MTMRTLLWFCLGLVFLVTFVLSLFAVALQTYSKISFTRLLEEKKKSDRARLLGLWDGILPAALFLRNGFFIAFMIFVILLFPSLLIMPLWLFLILLVVHVLFFDLLPRLLNALTRDRVIDVFLPSFRLIYALAAPLSFPRRRLSPKKTDEEDREATDEEIETFIDEAREEGIIEHGEDHLLRGVVEFGDTLVREIMTPRVDMVCIRDDATISKLRSLVLAEQYSRIPVYKDRIDNIEGLIHAKDLLEFSDDSQRDRPIKPLIRPVHFVPESMKVAELLKELQRRKEKMAIVVDEHGGVAGLLTIEDLVEEIVGEIQDEYDQEEALIHENGPQDYTVSGEVEVEEVEDLFDMDLAEDDYITMSGFLTHHLGRMPRKGEVLAVKGLLVEVLEVSQKKVIRMRLSRPAKCPPGENTGRS